MDYAAGTLCRMGKDMITDCHTHICCPLSDVETAGHIEACQKLDACIVLGVSQASSIDANRELAEYVKQHRKMSGFGVFDPVNEKVALKSVKNVTRDLGLDGVVLYCSRQGFHPTHSRAMRFYEAAEKLGLPIFFHNSSSMRADAILEYGRPYLIDEIAIKFPSLKIIIGAMGVPFVSETMCMIGKHENVYADLTITPHRTWEVYSIVIQAHEAGVMNKLLFGSGYPRASATDCIETLLGFNKLMADTHLPTVPREEIRSIIERDSLSLLGISSA